MVPVLAPQYVGIGPSTHRMDACDGLFPLKSDFGQCTEDAAALLKIAFFSVCVCGMPTARVACPTTAQSSCAAPITLQLAARHRSRVICHTWHGESMDVVRCMLRVACCMLHDVRRMLHVACCMMSTWCARSRSKQLWTHAHARATCTRGRSCRYGRGR